MQFLLMAFLLVGICAPIMTWMSPYLVLLIQEEEVRQLLEPLLSNPTLEKAIAQYLSLIRFMPFVVILLIMGSFAAERSSGITEYELSYPVKRWQLFLAKLIVDGSLLFVSVLLSGVICGVLSALLFDDIWLPGFVAVNGLVFLYLFFLMLVMIYGGLFVRSMWAAGGVALALFFVFRVFAAIPTIGELSPGGLLSAAEKIVVGRDAEQIEMAVGGTLLLSVGLLLMSLRKLNRMNL